MEFILIPAEKALNNKIIQVLKAAKPTYNYIYFLDCVNTN